MKQQIYIKLKPMSIEFYSQKDCPLNSRYSVIIQQNNTIYKSGIIKSVKAKYLQLSSLAWMEFMIDNNAGDSYVLVQIHIDQYHISQSCRRYGIFEVINGQKQLEQFEIISGV